MSSNDADNNSRIGPTVLWSMLKGKKVITNDGKDIGEIKDISDNYIHLEKGTIKKDKFWIPKYTADAYDGKHLWLLINEEEVHSKHVYGDESPRGEEYTKELDSFKNSPSGQKGEYSSGFEERIRIIENYKNIRDLK
jgi:sporulation protein YlmC with PRC-barrel domain